MRDPHKRKLSRHAYYNRNKERLNAEARMERMQIKTKGSRGFDFIIKLSRMTVEELKAQLDLCHTDEARRVVKGFIKELGG